MHTWIAEDPEIREYLKGLTYNQAISKVMGHFKKIFAFHLHVVPFS